MRDRELLLGHVHRDICEQRGGQVALAGVGQHAQDTRARALSAGDAQCACQRRARRDPDKDAFALRELSRQLERFGAWDGHELIHERARVFDQLGHEVGGPALHWMRVEVGVALARNPKLATALGPVDFHNLVTDYLLAHPSADPSVRFLGRHLPDLLRSHALGAQRPWLADLAALEWARIDVFDRIDQAPLSLDELRASLERGAQHLAIGAISALALVRAGHAVDDVWRQLHTEGRVSSVPAARECTMLVWRASDRYVYHRTLDASEDAAFPAVLGGVRFGALADLLGETHEVSEAARVLVRLAAKWVSERLLASSAK
jgi:hypothetical protein